MHTGVTQNSEEDRSAGSVGGAFAPVSSPARRVVGQPVILVFSQRPAAAHSAEADAIESDGESSFVSIGSIAVRLLATWGKPKMMLPPPGGVETAAPDDPFREG